MVKQNSRDQFSDKEIKDMMVYDPSEGKKVVDKLDLFQLIVLKELLDLFLTIILHMQL